MKLKVLKLKMLKIKFNAFDGNIEVGAPTIRRTVPRSFRKKRVGNMRGQV